MRRAGRWNWIYLKAEAARSESQGIGALDPEALFASSERANVTQLLPSLKHKIPCYLARDFIIVILPFFPLK
ncbi:hypothetical protein BK729_25715 [Bacillus thuringiensis serovar wratislaviensis]|nr:hypothetical protein BK729_25715 [Bacillus thuringiensis serovar wratislaviensis]OUB54085.1 hypothetical protein BK743_27785 [Bacillus thuringiensis serovar sylvestriensis]PEJ72563.1 hypothetical protein CN685_12015 [Bacillus wiedmannii]